VETLYAATNSYRLCIQSPSGNKDSLGIAVIHCTICFKR
jgi:hypothetical protein